jgi:hypothetical protein
MTNAMVVVDSWRYTPLDLAMRSWATPPPGMVPFFHVAAGKHWCERHAAGACSFLAYHQTFGPPLACGWTPGTGQVELLELQGELL